MDSAFKTVEVKNQTPILIVDKIGVVGQALAQELSKDYLVILVSKFAPDTKNKQLIHIPFKKKIPRVPTSRYSKIFLVDDGESVTRKSAFSFIRLAREEGIPLYFIGSVRNIDVEHAETLSSEYKGIKVLIFGDLFDRNIFFERNASVNKYILQARKNGRIEVAGEGLEISYPMAFLDTIKLIVKASYLDVKDRIILLFPPHPITDISLANTFKKVNPDIKVDFVKKEKPKRLYVPQGSVHAITKYDLEQRIRDLDLEDTDDREISIVGAPTQGRNFFKPLLFCFLIGFFMFLLPFASTFFYSKLGQTQLEAATKSFEEGNIEKAKKQITNSKTFFETAEKTSKPLIYELRVLRKEKEGEYFARQIESGKNLSQAGLFLIEGTDTIANLYKQRTKDAKGEFEKASVSFKKGLLILEKAKAQGQLSSDLEDKIAAFSPILDLLANSSDTAPRILGFDGEKKYLVLFQNNNELRPSGGYIEAVALVSLKNGKVTGFEVSDVYSQDQKLKAHVEPPYAIRRHLPSVHLYLRDSTFDPDFIQSAIAAANVYGLETKNEVDGVIGIDLEFAKKITVALGEVSVAGVSTVNDQTISSEALQNSKKGFFEEFAKSVKKSVEEKRDLSPLLLLEKVSSAVDEKNINFAFKDSDIQNVFTSSGLSSTLEDSRPTGTDRINDYFGLSEANLGGNQANYFVTRSVSKKIIVLDNGRVASRVNISFKNNSEKGSKLGGNYKNYLRIIVPEGSRITQIKIDDKEQKIVDAVTDPSVYEKNGYRSPQGIEVEAAKQSGKSIFGFLVNIGAGEIKTISILYDLPYTLPDNRKSADYSLILYKQPGVLAYPVDISFSLPLTYKIIEGEDKVSFSLVKDQNFSFKIAQK